MLSWPSLVFALTLSACNPLAKTEINAEWNPGVSASLSHSRLEISNSEITTGQSVTLTLQLLDKNSKPYVSDRTQIEFDAAGGTSQGVFSSITKLGDGRYSASFTGTQPGTPTTLLARINGDLLQGAALSLTVVSPNPTISTIADTSTNEDAAKAVVFLIEDADSTLSCSASHLSLTSSDPLVVDNSAVVWSGTAPNCTATITPVANAHGSSTLSISVTDGTHASTEDFVLTVDPLADDAFSLSWSFDALSEALYAFSASLIQFTSGIAELIGIDQTDNTATEFSTTSGASLTGVVWDGTKLKLGDAGGCDATATNCAELDATWTPQWGSLVGYWKMNGSLFNGTTNEVTDSSGHAFHGTTSGTVSASSGKIVSAATLASSSYVTVDSLPTSTTYTLSMWVNALSEGNLVSLRGTGDWTHTNYISGIDSNGKVTLVHVDDSNGISFIAGSTDIRNRGWTHLIFKYDGSNQYIYVDGALETSGTAASPVLTGFQILRFGVDAYFSDPGQSITGSLDEVAIWNTGLSEEQCQKVVDG